MLMIKDFKNNSNIAIDLLIENMLIIVIRIIIMITINNNINIEKLTEKNHLLVGVRRV